MSSGDSPWKAPARLPDIRRKPAFKGASLDGVQDQAYPTSQWGRSFFVATNLCREGENIHIDGISIAGDRVKEKHDLATN